MGQGSLSLHYANPLLERLGSEFFRSIPRKPGVYFMHQEDGEILYIGKAKDLRARLSSYKQAKPGAAAEHTLEMLESVARIRWEEHRSEEAALLREAELLHAVRPPFNIMGAWATQYLYIGLRAGEGAGDVDFQLTSRREIARGYRLYGCYKNRGVTKRGYTALLRLLHAASSTRKRFAFPARICRASPPYLYSMRLPEELVPQVSRFLAGRSQELLRELTMRMLANEDIPRFMHPSLQDDLDSASRFYKVGPLSTMKLRRDHEVAARVISHRKMDQLLRESCEEAG